VAIPLHILLPVAEVIRFDLLTSTVGGRESVAATSRHHPTAPRWWRRYFGARPATRRRRDRRRGVSPARLGARRLPRPGRSAAHDGRRGVPTSAV